MPNRLHEEKIEMERRHIRDAQVWIARQEEIVVRLDLMGSDELALQARVPLVLFHNFQVFARERLAYLEGKQSDTTPKSNWGVTELHGDLSPTFLPLQARARC